jgi:hypothetical protein
MYLPRDGNVVLENNLKGRLRILLWDDDDPVVRITLSVGQQMGRAQL